MGAWRVAAEGSWSSTAARTASLLIHVDDVQARTRVQERQRVLPAAQVRDACNMMPAYVYYPT